MTIRTEPYGVHLVGSFPLPDAEAVFRTASAVLGQHLRRLPDGETGDRANWILWQLPNLRSHPQLEVAPQEVQHYTGMPRFRLRAGVDPHALRFEHLGYADVALASYAIFQRLTAEGVIPAHIRFQVCIPPASAFAISYVVPDSREAVEAALEARLVAEVEQLCAA